VTELERILIERIGRDGPMPFAAFMQLALYHPSHGYYSAGPRTGWKGDFITSPELDPAYGALWARAFEKVWRAAGRPEGFTIVEVGPGEGGFTAAVLDAIDPGLRASLRYMLVERNPNAQARQRERLHDAAEVVWVPSIVDLSTVPAGAVFANEVLDNAPVHVVEVRDGDLTEVCVTLRDEGLGEELLPPSNPELASFVQRTGVDLVEGARYEVGLGGVSMARRLAAAIDRGAVFFVDYGDTAEGLSQRYGGTLVTYGASGPSAELLTEPGERDITSHANWTAIEQALHEAGMEVRGPIAQAGVLRALGLGAIDDQLRGAHMTALRNKEGVQAVATLSRRQAIRALIDPAGLGGLDVVTGTRGIELDLKDI
jgi:SAM-dependent MidA family methyltransferase